MYGHLASFILFLALVSVLPPVKRLQPSHRWLAALLVAVLATVPLLSCSIGGYCRGVIGDLSVTSLLFLLVLVYSNLAEKPLASAAFSAVQLKTVLGVLALVFYPMSLGASMLDPYWLGYQPEPLVIFTLALGLLACFSGYYFITAIMVCVQLGYSLRIMESTNFWDYLLDPAIATYCIAGLPKTITQSVAALSRRPKPIALPTAGYAKDTRQETI